MSKTKPPSPPPPSSKPPYLHQITTADKHLSATLHKFFTFLPRFLLKLLEISGDGRLWFPISISLILSPLSHHSQTLYSLSFSLLAGLITDIIVVGLIKHLVRRPRPVYNSYPMGPTFAVDHFSFPSGHASRACFLAAMFDLSIEAVDGEIVERWIGEWGSEIRFGFLIGFVWVWAGFTSVSRVLLGRHYVSDVVVGAVIGVLNGLFVYSFLRF